MVLAAQISWSENMDHALHTLSTGGDKNAVENVLQIVKNTLNVLADSVLYEQPPVRRKKLESLVSLHCILLEALECFHGGTKCKSFMFV